MPPTPPPPQPSPPPASIKLEDIYYILFRYKWLILASSVLGLIAAATVYFFAPSLYQSEAKLLVRFIVENKSVSPVGDDTQIKSPDARGENIINSELEILTSLDLAFQVATNIGPERILARAGGGNNPIAAAGMIREGLQVDVPRKSNIMRVIYQHPDPAIVQDVLGSVIRSYMAKHVDIHLGRGLLDDQLTRERDALRSKLIAAEQELLRLKTNLGVISIEETKVAYITESTQIRQDLFAAEAELAERKAVLTDLEKLAPAQSSEDAAAYGVTLEQLNTYKDLCTQVSALTTRHREMLVKYVETNPFVESVKLQLSQAGKDKKKMEDEHPKLKELGLNSSTLAGKPMDLQTELSRTKALESKITVLTGQLKRIQTDAIRLEEADFTIRDTQRKKELDEAYYRQLFTSIEKTRIDDALGAGKVTNINEVQSPSPPRKATDKLLKMVGGAFAGFVGLGFGLAALLGLFLDKSIKRSSDLETKVRLPVFITIPHTARNGHSPASKWLKFPGRKALPTPPSDPALTPGGPAQSSFLNVSPLNAQVSALNASLATYSEALRDRLITYFEVRNMTHKPKLVAVTGCHHGVGVTSIAANLAASLSETGEGNVLLVDMNQTHGAAHPFYRGKLACALPDVLESEKREAAHIQENLYMASANVNGNGLDIGNGHNDQLPRAMPKRFSHLVPKMKASDYDYIIFYMPPVNQTSITPRLANFMDMVLVVVEAEKTNCEVLKRAVAMLAESGSNVGTVLNKRITRIPSWLHQDI